MSINSKSFHFYEPDKRILQQVPENPYLGITISEDLKWSSHINKTTKKATQHLDSSEETYRSAYTRVEKTAYIALIGPPWDTTQSFGTHNCKRILINLKRDKVKKQDS